MDTFLNIIIIAGLGSLAVMWVFAVVMMLNTAWDTVGKHVLAFIKKLKR